MPAASTWSTPAVSLLSCNKHTMRRRRGTRAAYKCIRDHEQNKQARAVTSEDGKRGGDLFTHHGSISGVDGGKAKTRTHVSGSARTRAGSWRGGGRAHTRRGQQSRASPSPRARATRAANQARRATARRRRRTEHDGRLGGLSLPGLQKYFLAGKHTCATQTRHACKARSSRRRAWQRTRKARHSRAQQERGTSAQVVSGIAASRALDASWPVGSRPPRYAPPRRCPRLGSDEPYDFLPRPLRRTRSHNA